MTRAAEPTLRWSVGHGVIAAYSTAADGDLRLPEARARMLGRWRGPDQCIVANQVHGARVVRVDPGQNPGAADGLVTTAPIALGAFGADCPGLCIATPSAVGIAHCGWRGTASGIVRALVDQVASAAPHDPRDTWRALIGPGIAGCDYQVDAPVLGARVWPAEALTPQAGNRALLDLCEAIARDCAAAGVAQVRRCGINTRRDERLHSHRRSGAGIAQLLAVWRS